MLYPRDPEQEVEAYAEARNPWRTEAGGLIRFSRLALHPADAVDELDALLNEHRVMDGKGDATKGKRDVGLRMARVLTVVLEADLRNTPLSPPREPTACGGSAGLPAPSARHPDVTG